MMKYYSSAEMQQHNFYRMPKVLICDKKYRELSNNAKLLYAIILDRASLSESNAWIDEQNKVVVFLTIDEACKLLNIGHNTATKIFKELDDYGLIERKKARLRKGEHHLSEAASTNRKINFPCSEKGKEIRLRVK